MLCPYKKIIHNDYDFRTITNPLIRGTREEFGRCDEFDCIAYYEEGILDSNDFVSHCKRLEKETVYEENCD